MKSLYESMNGLYMLVYELQKNIEDDHIEIRKDVIIRIARQTTDCCYFIRDYASDPGFGMHLSSLQLTTVNFEAYQ